MDKPPEMLRHFANRLAQTAGSQDAAAVMRLLRQARLFTSVRETPPAGFPTDVSTMTGPQQYCVGIWERKLESNEIYFARRKELAREWLSWANVGRIEPKRTKYRVTLIGESVARGFLYDPQFTPAMVLEKMLRMHLGENEVEVIDLARTNLSFEVKDLAYSAPLLEPDLIVMFCGNNWEAGPPDPTRLSLVDTILRREGIQGLKRFEEEQLSTRVSSLVRDISDFYMDKAIPMIWIVPEFNLGDWRDPVTNAPFLEDGKNEQWMDLRRCAELAMQQGDIVEAAEYASKMLELDRGTCVTSLYMLAECSRHSHDLKAATRYLELARDSVIWDASKNIAPRSYSITQEILRQQAEQHGNAVVDLPQLFREYLNGDIPDRRLFVDYCHLSSEGIQLAMSATASCILQIITGHNLEWQGLMSDHWRPSSQVEAEASFLAAIHNAHWWQPYELIKYHCSTAVKLSPHISRIMISYIDLQTRRAPMLMCKSAEEISETGSPLMQNYLLRFNYQRLDSLLLDAVVDALKERGIDAGNQLQELRKEEHSVTRGPVDLLQFYYCSEGLQQQEIMWVMPYLNDYLDHKMHRYYKAFWRESNFVFVGEANKQVDLRLTCRLPNTGPASGSISLRVNGEQVGKAFIGHRWETWNFFVAGTIIRDGVNEVTITWPIPVFPGLKPLDSIATDLMERVYPELFCAFGEIHSLIASNGCKDSCRDSREELNVLAVQ